MPARRHADGPVALQGGERHALDPDQAVLAKPCLDVAVAAVTPQGVLAEMHRGMAEPGSGAD